MAGSELEKVRKSKSGVLVGEGGVTSAGWHSIEDFFICPKLYQFKHVRGIGTPAQYEPPYFTVGRMLHAGKAKWFAREFRDTDKTWAAVVQAMEVEAHTGKLPPMREALRDGQRYMREYIDHWSKRLKPQPIACEYKLGPAPFAKDDPIFVYRTARLDDVSRYPEAGGTLCIGETKTTSGSPNDVKEQYTLHGQTMLQFLLWRHAPQGEAMHGPVAGTVLDVIKKGYGKEKSKFDRVFIPFNEQTLEWFTKTLRGNLRAAAAVDWDAEVPRNPAMCCRTIGRKLVVCEFRDLCMHGRSASVKYVFKNGGASLLDKKQWKGVCGPWA